MKKLLIIITGILGFAGTVFALPFYQQTQSLLPGQDDKYNIGTTSPDQLWYKNIFSHNLTTASSTISGLKGGLIYANNAGNLSATSSPTIGWLYATTTATSTFLGNVEIFGQASTSKLFMPVSNSQENGVFYRGGYRFISDYSPLEQTSNLFIGRNSGNFTSQAGVAANVGIGENALKSLTFGGENAAVGYKVLENTTTGVSNLAFGGRALQANTTGAFNTAVGAQSMISNTTGQLNVGVGFFALSSNLIGLNNVAFGAYSLRNTLSDNNTGVGNQTLFYNATGTNNVAIGNGAGMDSTENVLFRSVRDNNAVFIGHNAHRAPDYSENDALTNIVAIGKNAKVGTSSAVILGGVGSESMKVAVGTSSPLYTLDINQINTLTPAGLQIGQDLCRVSADGTKLEYDFSDTADLFIFDDQGAFEVSPTIGQGAGVQTIYTAVQWAATVGTAQLNCHTTNLTTSGETDLTVYFNADSVKFSSVPFSQIYPVLSTPASLGLTQISNTESYFATTGPLIEFRVGKRSGSISTSIARISSKIQESYLNDGGALTFSTANTSGFLTERAIVNNLGYFGLGTTTPFSKLSISGNSLQTTPLLAISTSTALATSTAILIDSNGKIGVGTSTPYAQLSNSGLTASGYYNADNATATSSLTGGLIVDNPTFVVDYSSGKIGIGTTNPFSKLTVYQDTSADIRIYSGPSGMSSFSFFEGTPTVDPNKDGFKIKYDGVVNALKIYVVDTSVEIETRGMTILRSNGNVGVGTTSPYAKLSTEGTTASSNFQANQITATSTFSGDLLFNGSGQGLSFGSMYSNTETTVSVAASGTWYEVTSNMTLGEANNMNLGGGHYLVVTKPGRYLISYGMAIETGSALQEIAGAVTVNGTASETSHGHTTVGSANQSTQVSGTTILNLALGDQISLSVQNHSSATDVLISHSNLTIIQVGG